MQSVQQCAQVAQCCSRNERRADTNVRSLCRVGDPRGEAANGPVGQLAENVLAPWELYSSLNAKTLSVQRVKPIVNLDNLGPMGIMFLARLEAARRTAYRQSVRN
jgi:hypothetical protein